MRTQTRMYGLAAVGTAIGFLAVLLATVVAFGAEIAVGLPVAAAVGLAAGAGTYLWLRATADRPDPMLG